MSSIGGFPKGQRISRVKLGGSILALVLLENGRQIRARMNQLSANGGVLSLEQALDEGIKVSVLFHLGSTTRSRAEMLFPIWATKGCFQPFRFLELPVSVRDKLASELNALAKAGVSPRQESE